MTKRKPIAQESGQPSSAHTRASAAARADAPSAFALDALDRSLLALLQANARESVTTLAKRLGIARTTALARTARLEQSGVITGYSVRLNQAALERSLQAFVGLSVHAKSGRDVLKQLAKMPEIKVVYSVSGEVDYVCHLRADTANALDALLDEIGELEGVLKTHTSVVLAERLNRG